MRSFMRGILNSYFKQSLVAVLFASIYMLVFMFFIFTESSNSRINDATLYSLQITAIHLVLYIGIISVYLEIWCQWNLQNSNIVSLLRQVHLLSIILIILTPFIGEVVPVTNSYVPFNDNLLFILGISIFSASVLIQVIYFIWHELLLILKYKNIFCSYKLPSLLLVLNLYLKLSLSYIHLSQDIGIRRMHLSFYYDKLFYNAADVMYYVYAMLCVILLHGAKTAFTTRTNLGLKPKFSVKLLYTSITVSIKSKAWILLLYIISVVSFITPV